MMSIFHLLFDLWCYGVGIWLVLGALESRATDVPRWFQWFFALCWPMLPLLPIADRLIRDKEPADGTMTVDPKK